MQRDVFQNFSWINSNVIVYTLVCMQYTSTLVKVSFAFKRDTEVELI